MYEENQQPLPAGDATLLFAKELAEIARLSDPRPPRVAAEEVWRSANREAQSVFARMCRRLLLPGSRIEGAAQLVDLGRRAAEGRACLLCLTHRSNLDVPTLRVLLEDQSDPEVFHRIVWIAGRKLIEESRAARMLAGCFNRVIVTPHSWLREDHTDEELHEAHRINMSAQRTVLGRRHAGWIFGLFPGGTRIRPGDDRSARAIEETDSYLKAFDDLLLCHIAGCTLPVSRDREMAHETPRTDRVVYTFGPVLDVEAWRSGARERFPELDQRHATARAIMVDLEALGQGGELRAPERED